MDVIATDKGYIHGQLRHAGDRFSVTEDEFSDEWMEKVATKRGKAVAKATADVPDLVDDNNVIGLAKATADVPDLVDDNNVIGLAKEMTGRDDIDTVEEAKAIIDAAGGL